MILANTNASITINTQIISVNPYVIKIQHSYMFISISVHITQFAI